MLCSLEFLTFSWACIVDSRCLLWNCTKWNCKTKNLISIAPLWPCLPLRLARRRDELGFTNLDLIQKCIINSNLTNKLKKKCFNPVLIGILNCLEWVRILNFVKDSRNSRGGQQLWFNLVRMGIGQNQLKLVILLNKKEWEPNNIKNWIWAEPLSLVQFCLIFFLF